MSKRPRKPPFAKKTKKSCQCLYPLLNIDSKTGSIIILILLFGTIGMGLIITLFTTYKSNGESRSIDFFKPHNDDLAPSLAEMFGNQHSTMEHKRS